MPGEQRQTKTATGGRTGFLSSYLAGHASTPHQVARFVTVGSTSYVINVSLYALQLLVGIDYRVAAVTAFLCAITNSFIWNRRWTFLATHKRPHHQVPRFLVVASCTLAVNLTALELLVDADLPKVFAGAAAALIATPVSFTGNKLWTFRLEQPSD